MSQAFVREDRYLVLKRKDIQAAIDAGDLVSSDVDTMETITYAIQCNRQRNGKQPLECVVVESDWAEYEPVWRAIERRMMSPEQFSTHFKEVVGNAELRERMDAFLEDKNEGDPTPIESAQLLDIIELLRELKYGRKIDANVHPIEEVHLANGK